MAGPAAAIRVAMRAAGTIPAAATAASSLQAEAPRLVLASGSAARRHLLQAAALSFDVHPAPIDEAACRQQARAAGDNAGQAALRLAGQKAAWYSSDDALVLGCDQILLCGDRWFDKAASLPEARSQLEALRGQTHTLQTASVIYQNGQEVWRNLAAPILTMRWFSDAFLEAYLALERSRLLASVGCYRLEGPGIQLFEAIEGDHTAILGLPMAPLLSFLRLRKVLLA